MTEISEGDYNGSKEWAEGNQEKWEDIKSALLREAIKEPEYLRALSKIFSYFDEQLKMYFRCAPYRPIDYYKLVQSNNSQASKLMELEQTIRKLRIEVVKMSIEADDLPKEIETAISKFQEKTKTNVSIMSGGKDGEGNWLAGLKKGAVFHSRPKSSSECDVEQWHLKVKWGKTAGLYSNFPQNRECYRLVDMLSFSRQNDLLELVREEEQELRYD